MPSISHISDKVSSSDTCSRSDQSEVAVLVAAMAPPPSYPSRIAYARKRSLMCIHTHTPTPFIPLGTGSEYVCALCREKQDCENEKKRMFRAKILLIFAVNIIIYLFLGNAQYICMPMYHRFLLPPPPLSSICQPWSQYMHDIIVVPALLFSSLHASAAFHAWLMSQHAGYAHHQTGSKKRPYQET